PGAGDGYAYPISRNYGTDKLWRVECCTFGDLNAAGSAILVNTGKVLVRDCVFASSTGVYSVRLQGGTAIVESCRHTNAKGIYCDAFTGDCVLELYNNRFDISCQPQLNPYGASKIKIRGEQNRFYENPASYGEGFFLVGGGAGVANLSGDLQCGRGIGAYSYAAGVLTINWNYDTFSIDEGGG